MQVVIWGAGERGKRLLFHLGQEKVLAFIDVDIQKIGTRILDKEIISYESYLEKYLGISIVISTHEESVIKKLNEDGIFNYFCMSDCPEDFQSSYPRNILKDNIQKNIEANKQYVIYGETLYGVLLFQWITELNPIHSPYLIVTQKINLQLLESLRKAFGEFVKTGFAEVENENLDKIFIVHNSYEKEIPIGLQAKVEKVLRYSERIKEYFNEDIERFKNIHQGKRCFIVATGPSLLMEDLEMLKKNKEICISMNSIFRMFPRTMWRPDYYVAQDYRVVRDNEDWQEQLEGITAFMSDGCLPLFKEKLGKNIFVNHMGLLWNAKELMPFSENFAQICYVSGTVTYSCMQLAVYMGFSEIYLLGVDFSGSNGHLEKYAHCYGEKVQSSTCFEDQVLVSYQSAQKYAEEHDIKIYNATRGGKLEIFERVNFDDLF